MKLDALFHPKSIAVIGVSRDAKKLGSAVCSNILRAGYRGRVYPIHPSLKRFAGRRVFARLADVRAHIDLVIIVTPAATVPQLLTECGKAGCKNVIVISAGFRETGAAGALLERSVRRTAAKYRINLLGPNCLGVLHAPSALNASFSFALPKEGTLAILSQSGAMAVAMTDWARTAGVPFRSLVSLGNKAGITEVDLLNFYARDAGTQAVLCYLESSEHGKDFALAVRSAVKRKPVVILKAGVSAAGQRAALSHTGALASSGSVFTAAMRREGAIVVEHIDDLFNTAMLLASVRRLRGPNVAIVTNAGGPGIMTADAIGASSLSFAPLSAATRARLRSVLPAAANTANPIDLVGDADVRRYTAAIDVLARDKNIHALLVILTPQVVTNADATAQAIIRLHKRFPQLPLLTSFLGDASVTSARAKLNRAGIPHFTFPEDAVGALDRLWVSQSFGRPVKQAMKVPESEAETKVMTPPVALRLLKRHGIAVAPFALVHSEADVLRAARKFGFPIALKLIRRSIIHKAREQAVWLDLGLPQLRSVLRKQRSKTKSFDADEGWLVQPMITGRSEWFLGATRDPAFGPVVLLGRGGGAVELQRAVVTLFPPFRDADVALALARIGEHDLQASRVRELAHAVRAVYAALRSTRALVQLEVNPLLLHPAHPALSIDARGVFSS